MKHLIQHLSLAVGVSAMLFIGCAAPGGGDTPAGKDNAGYVWGRAGVWNIGDAAAAEIWRSDSWSLMFQKLHDGIRRSARFIFGTEKRAHSSVG